MLVASAIDYRIYSKLVYPFLGLSSLAIVLCQTPFGRTIKGASRWIGIGSFTIQPSEIVKLALVLWLSYSLAKKHDKIKSFSIGFLPHVLIPGTLIILCLLQPDFGTAAVIGAVTFSLLFIAGAKLGYMLLACISAAPIAYFLIMGSEYRLKRILAFLDPISNRFEDGYQLSQSLFGFSSGGIWGVGIGDGLQKLLFLPEAHNDFIAPIIAEELGVVGIWAVLLVFLIIFVRGVIISFKATDELGSYMAIGITILIGVQALTNLGVAMGLLPTKGLNLPFISYGGSALIMSFLSVGILLNISKQKPGGPLFKNEVLSLRNIRRKRAAPETGEDLSE
jgi:cell division protein FtsW